MSYINLLSQAYSSMSEFSQAMENSSRNISYSEQNGYKRSDYSFQDHVNGVESPLRIDARNGELEFTGAATDLAIADEGFMLLGNGKGDFALTSSAQFRLADDGQLIDNDSGYALLSSLGRAITVDSQSAHPGSLTSKVSISGQALDDDDVTFELGDDARWPFEDYPKLEFKLVKVEAEANDSAAEADADNDEAADAITATDPVGDTEVNVSTEETGPVWTLEAYVEDQLLASTALTLTDDKLSLQDFNMALTARPGDASDIIVEQAVDTFDAATDAFTVTVEEEGFHLAVEGGDTSLTSGALRLTAGEKITLDNQPMLFTDSDGKPITIDADSILTSPAQPTSEIYFSGVLPKSAVVGETLSVSSAEFRSADAQVVNLDFEFQKVSDEEWSFAVKNSDSGEILTSGKSLVFLQGGAVSPISRSFLINVGGTDVKLGFFDDQYGALSTSDVPESSVAVSHMDGADEAQLSGLSLAADGTLTAKYSNGSSDDIGRLKVDGDQASAHQITLDLEVDVVSGEGQQNKVAVEHNGTAEGQFSRLAIASDGAATAQYDNGESVVIGSVDIYTLPESQRLQEGRRYFELSSTSGLQKHSDGRFRQGYVEGANVDQSAEYERILDYQKGYQAASQSLSVASEMLEELYGLFK